MNPIRISIAVLGLVAISACVAPQTSSEPVSVDAKAAAALASSFTGAPSEWQQRLVQDDVQMQCSAARGKPSGEVAGAIVVSQQATLKYPDSGLMGDWKEGEKIAQSGVGLQYSDKPGTVPGGNCYACHQIA